MAPEIRATVMIANVAWKATYTSAGIEPTSGKDTAPAVDRYCPTNRPLRPKCWNGLPSRPPPTSFPNDIE
jgi:hypothetical protein